MCLTSKHKLKEKFRFVKEGEACASSPRKQIQNMCLNLKGREVIQYFVIKNEENKIQQYG